MSTATAMLPQLTTLVELSNKINEIVAWTVANPVDDHVFHIPLPSNKQGPYNNLAAFRKLGNINGYIAGSTALYWYIIESHTDRSGKWKPTDGDVFFLGQDINTRMQIGPIDLVLCKQKTVEDLLIDFDLPICRAALSFSYDFWISAQCLAAIHTRRQNCPAYLRSKITFKSVLTQALKPGLDEDHPDENKRYNKARAESAHDWLYSRFIERVKKYQDRGFGVNWIDTPKLIPWVINRFHYGEWLMTNLPTTEAAKPAEQPLVMLPPAAAAKEHCLCHYCSTIMAHNK